MVPSATGSLPCPSIVSLFISSSTNEIIVQGSSSTRTMVRNIFRLDSLHDFIFDLMALPMAITVYRKSVFKFESKM